MNATTVFDFFSFLSTASMSATKPSKLRGELRASIVARRNAALASAPEKADSYMRQTAQDLVEIDDEIRRTNRRIAAKVETNLNYAIALEVLQDEMRRDLHLLDHGRVGLVMAFFGVKPEMEWEVRKTRALREAIGTEIDARIEKIAREAAAATVAALRSTPQKPRKSEEVPASA